MQEDVQGVSTHILLVQVWVSVQQIVSLAHLILQGFSMHVLLEQIWVLVQQTVSLVQASARGQGLSSIMMQVCSLTHTGGGGGGGQPPMRASLWQSTTVSQITGNNYIWIWEALKRASSLTLSKCRTQRDPN
jgi:hypothetical protein